MKLAEAISLITNKRILDKRAIWADLGCGTGLFTMALAHLLHPGSTIHAVDRNRAALNSLSPPPGIILEKLAMDFIHEELPFNHLDGILMANSLHYTEDKISLIRKLESCLKEDGLFLIVEYEINISSRWVPYPASYLTLKQLFEKLGWPLIEKLGEHPSVFQRGNIYSAVIRK
jgi:SAM-dependent methyltransferase